MKKTISFTVIFCIILLLTLFVPTALFAQEDDAQEKDGIGDIGIRAVVGMASSVSEGYIVPDISLLYKLSAFSLGGGAKFYSGLSFGDVYVVPYLSGGISWFSVDVGMAFQIVEPDSESVNVESDTPIYFGAKLYPTIPLGPGKLTFGAGLSVFASPVEEVESDSIIGKIMGTVIISVLNLTKVEAGIGYILYF